MASLASEEAFNQLEMRNVVASFIRCSCAFHEAAKVLALCMNVGVAFHSLASTYPFFNDDSTIKVISQK